MFWSLLQVFSHAISARDTLLDSLLFKSVFYPFIFNFIFYASDWEGMELFHSLSNDGISLICSFYTQKQQIQFS